MLPDWVLLSGETCLYMKMASWYEDGVVVTTPKRRYLKTALLSSLVQRGEGAGKDLQIHPKQNYETMWQNHRRNVHHVEIKQAINTRN